MFRGIGDLNNPSSGDGNSPSFMERAKGYYSSIPMIVKIIATCTVIFYILSWIPFCSFLILLLANTPYYTIFRFFVWTLVTTIVITPSILNILFAFLAWLPRGVVMEKEIGSTRFALNMIARSTIIQSMYTLLMAFFAIFFGVSALKVPSMGLWPIILSDITIQCLQDPERETMFFFIPYPIKAKYYPWVLIGFFTLLNFNIQFDIFCGVIFGYLYHYKLKEKLEFSHAFVDKTEKSCFFACIRNRESFVPSSSTIGGSAFSFSAQNNNNDTTSNSNTYEVRKFNF